MKYQSRFVAILLFTLPVLSANAQNIENAPLSRFGFGELRSMSTGLMLGMGNAGAGYHSENLYNPLNPAASAFLKQTDVELGIYAKYNKLEDEEKNTFRGWTGNLNHIFLAIPLRNSINELLDRKVYKSNFALQFGLTPYSSVGYKSELIDSAQSNNILYRYLQGDGLLNAFQFGASYRYKDLAVGIQFNYIFGTFNYYQNLLYTSIPASYDSYLTDKYHMSGIQPVLGFMYRIVLNQKEIEKDNSQRKKLFSAGLSLIMPSNLNSTYSALHMTRFEDNISLVDTLLFVDEQQTDAQLPFGIKIGGAYSHQDKYGLMASIHYDAWQNAKVPIGIPGSVNSATQFQIGAWLRPGLSSFDKFFKKSIYRFGAYVGKDYRVIDGEQAQSLGLTFGWAYPIVFLRQDALIHLNFDLGQRELGTQLKENYFNIHFGISINDNEWFLRRRYN